MKSQRDDRETSIGSSLRRGSLRYSMHGSIDGLNHYPLPNMYAAKKRCGIDDAVGLNLRSIIAFRRNNVKMMSRLD